jgi:hypothetical protein
MAIHQLKRHAALVSAPRALAGDVTFGNLKIPRHHSKHGPTKEELHSISPTAAAISLLPTFLDAEFSGDIARNCSDGEKKEHDHNA